MSYICVSGADVKDGDDVSGVDEVLIILQHLHSNTCIAKRHEHTCVTSAVQPAEVQLQFAVAAFSLQALRGSIMLLEYINGHCAIIK